MKIDKSTLKRLIKEAIKDIQEASENPFDTPEMKALAKASRDAKTAAKQRAAAKKSNPAATKFDVMNKLNKKVGNMAMKVIVGALEKDPKVMTTLSMVLKEEVETLTERTDPRGALEGTVDAAVARAAEKLAGKKSEDVGKELRDIQGKLAKEIAENFLKNFDAKQKD